MDADRIVFVGRSLGGGAVRALSPKRPSAGLILISTFTSARSFAKRYLVPPILIRYPFDNLKALNTYAEPILIRHGRQDTVIPFSNAKALQAAAGDARLIAYDVGHYHCPPHASVFWQDIESVLRHIGVLAAS